MPKITVLMPVYNSASHLRETMDSLFSQTWTDWDMVAVCEYCNDNSIEILQEYAKRDKRIAIVVNETRLGLAQSLNKGILMAEGEYIARADAGDISLPDRFEKQVSFLELHPNVGLVGTYQEHFGTENWVHRPVISPEEQKIIALFHCDVCHSTVMFRRALFVENSLFYDDSFLAEDYELWTRAVQITDFATIPEVLGRYRHDDENITTAKKDAINIESGFITGRELQKNLRIEDLEESDYFLLRSWSNVFQAEHNPEKRRDMLERYRQILLQIWYQNQKLHMYNDKHLLYRLNTKWRWAKYGEDWKYGIPAKTIAAIEDPEYDHRLSTKTVNFLYRLKNFFEANPSFRSKVKKLVKWALHPLSAPLKRHLKQLIATAIDGRIWKAEKNILATIDGRIRKAEENALATIDSRIWKAEENVLATIDGRIWKAEENVLATIDGRVWNAEKRIMAILPEVKKNTVELLYLENRVPLHRNEKIRIIFLFQIPTAWASWESVWEIITKDERFDVKMVLYDKVVRETSQLKGAREFLEENGIPFEHADDFSFLDYRPHIIMYQTPWDHAWRPRYLQADQMKKQGYRIADICYGIEFTNSAPMNFKFTHLNLRAKPWRLYEISEKKRQDHLSQSPQGNDFVVATGHPKFDSLANRDKYQLPEEYRTRIAERKIVFWTLHFPHEIEENFPTPFLEEYINFAHKLNQYPDLFFLVRPHPKFFDVYIKKGCEEETTEFRNAICASANACFHEENDYRNALYAADFVIGDRSALMIEACALQVPTIYMTNFSFMEEIFPSVAPIFDSYYQGTGCYDIETFIDIVIKRGIDYKKEERAAALRECIPYLDGQCGQRIVDDMANTMYSEMR